MSDLPFVFSAAGLRISFHRCADRIAHTIALLENGQVLPLLASVEATDCESAEAENWPASPPLTTIETQGNDPRCQAMLLGMAGNSHWSVVVEMETAANRLRFDVACRVKEAPLRLGSSYRSMVPLSHGEDGLLLQLPQGEVRIGATDATVEPTDEGLDIRIVQATGAFPQTVCWSYTISRTQ